VKGGVSAVGHLQGLQNPDGLFRYTGYVIDNPARMTASAVPALMGIPYPVDSIQVQHSQFNGTAAIQTSSPPRTLAATTPPMTSAVLRTTVPGERSVTITDDFGEAVTIRGLPRRIVSLAPSNTEILYALGLGDRVIGVTDYCNYPEEARARPKVGGYSTVNLEKVVALEPDLVVGSFGNTEDAIKRLRSLGLTVVTLNPQTIDDIFHDIRLVGTMTGTEGNASACVDGLRQRVRVVEQKTSDLSSRPSVAQVVWYDPIWVSGRNTFQDEVIQKAGGKNSFNLSTGWAIIGLEEFFTTDPEYIIVNSGTGMGDSAYDILHDYFMNEPRLQNVSAVRNGHVYTIDADIISRGGPRIVDALEVVAAELHPEAFGNVTSSATPTPRAPGFGWIVAVVALACIVLLAGKRR
jgi:iron complex transport system substrate-binding protein